MSATSKGVLTFCNVITIVIKTVFGFFKVQSNNYRNIELNIVSIVKLNENQRIEFRLKPKSMLQMSSLFRLRKASTYWCYAATRIRKSAVGFSTALLSIWAAERGSD